MGILLGFIAAIGWGAGDFFVRGATHVIGTYRSVIYMQLFGLVGLSILLVGSGYFNHSLVQVGIWPWLWGLAAAALNVGSSLALYQALKIGVVSIMSPVVASYAVVTVILSFLSGESISQIHAIGMGVVLTGIVCAVIVIPRLSRISRISRREKYINVIDGVIDVDSPASAESGNVQDTHEWQPFLKRLPRGLLIALGAAVGYGITFWILGFRVTPYLGGIAPVWLIRLSTPIMLMVAAPLFHQGVAIPRGRVWWTLAIAGILDTTAYISYTIGVTVAEVAVMSVLASLYSAVTVLLAALFLHERLHWNQWLGIGAILVGVGLINL